MSLPLTFAMRTGHVWANEDASAVALWLPPGRTTIGLPDMLQTGLLRMPVKVGRPSRTISRSAAW